MKKAQYVLVAEDDIPLGRPLPWAIFLRSGELLAPAGYLIADKASQGRLLQAKPMRAARADDAQRSLIDVTDPSDGMPKPTTDPLQSLKHNVEGIVLAFQLPGDFEARSAPVEFYGRVPLQSIIVSAPVMRASNGQSWQHFEGLPMSAQIIFGRTMSVFKTSLMRFAPLPSGHLFLRYPTEAVSKPFRQSLRVDVKLPASIILPDGTVPGIVTNLSSGGCAIASGFVLGDVGAILNIALRLKIGAKPHLVQLKATIRAVKGKSSQQMQYGVAFDAGMDEATQLLLMSFVYEHLAEP
jgi:hypothetical protein